MLVARIALHAEIVVMAAVVVDLQVVVVAKAVALARAASAVARLLVSAVSVVVVARVVLVRVVMGLEVRRVEIAVKAQALVVRLAGLETVIVAVMARRRETSGHSVSGSPSRRMSHSRFIQRMPRSIRSRSMCAIRATPSACMMPHASC